jgi:hypothetical protein
MLQSDSLEPNTNLTEKSYNVFGFKSVKITFRSVEFLNLYLAFDISAILYLIE